jgi:DNA-binding MarR family transcriptional regulator
VGDREDWIRRVLDAQARVHRLAGTAADAWMDAGLTSRQARALVVLDLRGPVTVGGLGRVLRVSNASASELVERLVIAGLAQRDRDPSDRRRVPVILTAEGAALAHRLRSAGDDAWSRVLAVLDDAELRAVAAGMEVLAAACERVQGGAVGGEVPLGGPGGGRR